MARPKKETVTSETVTPSEQTTAVDVTQKDLDAFQHSMQKMVQEQMQAMMAQLLEQTKQAQQQTDEKVEQIEKTVQNTTKKIESIRPFPNSVDYDMAPMVDSNKMIRVMSIVNGGLTLFTGPNGRRFRFNKFGDISLMTYQELLLVISNHPKAANNGYFLIMDTEAIDGSGLRNEYVKFVTPEIIKNIMAQDVSVIQEVMTTTTDKIKETILEFVYEQINTGQYFDRNKIALLSQLTGKNIEKNAKILKDGIPFDLDSERDEELLEK